MVKVLLIKVQLVVIL